MKEKYQKKCCAIFRMKNASGSLEAYVSHLLAALVPYLRDLMIICSKNIQKDEYVKVTVFTKEVIQYDNLEDMEDKTLDCCRILLARGVDQVLLLDDSFYGPFYLISDMFAAMEGQRFGMWGLTSLQQGELSPMTSCFVVLHHNILELGISKITDKYRDAGTDIVAFMIERLLDNGIEWKSYITLPASWKPMEEATIDLNILLSYELVKDFFCPFILKQALLDRTLEHTDGSNARRTLEYLRYHTNYDTNLIWDNLLRTCHIRDLKEALGLEYVLSEYCSKGEPDCLKQRMVAIIVHLHYEDLILECMSYLKQISENIDLYITTSDPNVKERVEKVVIEYAMKNCTILLKENRGRDVSAFLVTYQNILLKYEYICFIHDKKTSQASSFTFGKVWMSGMWENTVKSADYINNIIQCFEDNPKLGLLSTPEPYHDTFFGNMGNLWANTFEQTEKLSKMLKLKVKLSKSKSPFVISTAFWCRTIAMEPLFAYPFTYEDFPDEPMKNYGELGHAVERILPYVAQHQGYYSGIVMNEAHAALRGSNLQCLLEMTLKVLKEKMIVSTVADIKNFEKRNEAIEQFCGIYPHILIYGTGKYGKQYAEMLIEKGLVFDGFVVSDGQPKVEQFLEHMVYYLSELTLCPAECGILLMVGKQFQKEIIPQLQAKGYCNLYIVE